MAQEEKAKRYKVLFADLDGTLIDTICGDTFPKGIWDMQFKWDVLTAIKDCGFEILIIVSNQGGIEKGFVDERHFCKGKMNYIQFALMEYLGIPVEYDYCKFNNKDNYFRKPNIGMLEHVCFKNLPKHNIIASKKEMLMIGDASGQDGQFSDSDLQCAKNAGIKYCDVDDFINAADPCNLCSVGFACNYEGNDWIRPCGTSYRKRLKNVIVR